MPIPPEINWAELIVLAWWSFMLFMILFRGQ